MGLPDELRDTMRAQKPKTIEQFRSNAKIAEALSRNSYADAQIFMRNASAAIDLKLEAISSKMDMSPRQMPPIQPQQISQQQPQQATNKHQIPEEQLNSMSDLLIMKQEMEQAAKRYYDEINTGTNSRWFDLPNMYGMTPVNGLVKDGKYTPTKYQDPTVTKFPKPSYVSEEEQGKDWCIRHNVPLPRGPWKNRPTPNVPNPNTK